MAPRDTLGPSYYGDRGGRLPPVGTRPVPEWGSRAGRPGNRVNGEKTHVADRADCGSGRFTTVLCLTLQSLVGPAFDGSDLLGASSMRESLE